MESVREFRTIMMVSRTMTYSPTICNVDILLLNKVSQFYERIGSHVTHKVSKRGNLIFHVAAFSLGGFPSAKILRVDWMSSRLVGLTFSISATRFLDWGICESSAPLRRATGIGYPSSQ